MKPKPTFYRQRDMGLARRLSRQVLRRRKALGLSQMATALRVGLSHEIVSRIERVITNPRSRTANVNPGLDVIAALAVALECEAWELLR